MNNIMFNDLLSLEYGGSAVELGRMDSYQVATYIMAFSDFLGVLTKNTFAEKVELKTEIQGIRGETFDIDFYLSIATLTVQTISFLDSAIGLKEYFELIKDSIKVWIHLKGMPLKEIIPQKNNYQEIVNNDGLAIYVKDSVVNFISDTRAGKAAEKFIGEPLGKGISELSIKSAGLSDLVKIEKKDAPYFKQFDIENPLPPTDIEMNLQIESPTFIEGNKWKFFDGENSWFADIQDENFILRVKRGIERFGAGDTLKVLIRICQFTTPSSIKIERSIIKVIKHNSVSPQTALI